MSDAPWSGVYRLLGRRRDAFDDREWLYELKWDG
jgi:hypothetical protein